MTDAKWPKETYPSMHSALRATTGSEPETWHPTRNEATCKLQAWRMYKLEQVVTAQNQGWTHFYFIMIN